ncbi:hypothetical protein PVAP13_3NG079579 [Panicum virgatum]|uniref:Uncharacterized protein n=1 Tax=Panicum virgatum TaxID=38727 RepID=A0A8T0U8Q4_PANVG|nr:hypothetical protein PVAP13_3NG079579 [Panicum virgatum]
MTYVGSHEATSAGTEAAVVAPKPGLNQKNPKTGGVSTLQARPSRSASRRIPSATKPTAGAGAHQRHGSAHTTQPRPLPVMRAPHPRPEGNETSGCADVCSPARRAGGGSVHGRGPHTALSRLSTRARLG